MTQLIIQEDGVVKVYDENHKEYVRILLQVDETDNLKVQLKVKECYSYGNKLYPKNPLNLRAITDFIDEDLKVSEDSLDVARTTPSFAKHFNTVIGDILERQGHADIMPYTNSYSDGYSFVGEAFINFVTALVVYDMYPDDTSSELTNYANSLRNNDYLAGVSMNMGWSRYLTKMKQTSKHHRYFKKEIASSYKGLVGSLYEDNGIDKITELMKFVKNTVTPDSTLELPDTKKHQTHLMYLLITIFSTVFGWMVCYMTLTMFQKKYEPFHVCYSNTTF